VCSWSRGLAWLPAYGAVGAELHGEGALPWSEVDGVLCVNPPPLETLAQLRSGALLVGLLNPYGAAAMAESLVSRGVSSIALELLPRISPTPKKSEMDMTSCESFPVNARQLGSRTRHPATVPPGLCQKAAP
jgi:NAD/NADP transhydrogenase alpha subunit